MYRKVPLLVMVALAVTLAAATVAAGAPASDPNCTFDGGKTTCVTTEESFYMDPVGLYEAYRSDPCIEAEGPINRPGLPNCGEAYFPESKLPVHTILGNS